MQHFQVIKDNWNELDVPFSLVSENKRRVEVRSGAEVQYCTLRSRTWINEGVSIVLQLGSI